MLDKIGPVFQAAMKADSKNAQLFQNASGSERWGYIGSSLMFVVVIVLFLLLGYFGKDKWPGVGWYIWLLFNWLLLVLGVITLGAHVWMKMKGK